MLAPFFVVCFDYYCCILLLLYFYILCVLLKADFGLDFHTYTCTIATTYRLAAACCTCERICFTTSTLHFMYLYLLLVLVLLLLLHIQHYTTPKRHTLMFVHCRNPTSFEVCNEHAQSYIHYQQTTRFVSLAESILATTAAAHSTHRVTEEEKRVILIVKIFALKRIQFIKSLQSKRSSESLVKKN